MNLNKSEAAWIGIRLFGLFFLYQAFLSIVEVCVAAFSLYENTSVAWGVNSEDRVDAVTLLSIRLGAYAVFYFGLSFYFLKKGKFFHNLVMRASGDDET